MASTSAAPYTEYIKIGKVLDAHALKGEIFVFIFSGDVSWLESEEFDHCLLSRHEDLAGAKDTEIKSFKIERASEFKNGLRLKLENVNDRNQSEALKGHFLFLHPDLFISEEGETIYLKEILGFEVLRMDKSVIGQIIGFSSNGPQDLLVIERSGESAPLEIPFVEQFTHQILFDQRKIILDLPEGMEDLGT